MTTSPNPSPDPSASARQGADAGATCSACGVTLPSGTRSCPRCLLRLGLDDPAPTRQFATDPPTPAELSARLPGLSVLELVGRGGMGLVYKARQLPLDRIVALKILPGGRGDGDFEARFEREGKALARLSHPNIVGVHDFGVTDGLHWLVMEFVDGASLRQVLAQGHLSPEEALRIVPQICDALSYAHARGVVHRDIKPENILLDRDGRLKIADFGLAKLVGRDASPYGLTGTEQVMGTPRYMAPEQVDAPLSVDHRADIYALGVVFYEMLTGRLPIGRFEPPSARARIDVRLDEVVLRSLEQDPERRYQLASDVKTDIERATTPSDAKGAGGRSAKREAGRTPKGDVQRDGGGESRPGAHDDTARTARRAPPWRRRSPISLGLERVLIVSGVMVAVFSAFSIAAARGDSTPSSYQRLGYVALIALLVVGLVIVLRRAAVATAILALPWFSLRLLLEAEWLGVTMLFAVQALLVVRVLIPWLRARDGFDEGPIRGRGRLLAGAFAAFVFAIGYFGTGLPGLLGASALRPRAGSVPPVAHVVSGAAAWPVIEAVGAERLDAFAHGRTFGTQAFVDSLLTVEEDGDEFVLASLLVGAVAITLLLRAQAGAWTWTGVGRPALILGTAFVISPIVPWASVELCAGRVSSEPDAIAFVDASRAWIVPGTPEEIVDAFGASDSAERSGYEIAHDASGVSSGDLDGHSDDDLETVALRAVMWRARPLARWTITDFGPMPVAPELSVWMLATDDPRETLVVATCGALPRIVGQSSAEGEDVREELFAEFGRMCERLGGEVPDAGAR